MKKVIIGFLLGLNLVTAFAVTKPHLELVSVSSASEGMCLLEHQENACGDCLFVAPSANVQLVVKASGGTVTNVQAVFPTGFDYSSITVSRAGCDTVANGASCAITFSQAMSCDTSIIGNTCPLNCKAVSITSTNAAAISVQLQIATF